MKKQAFKDGAYGYRIDIGGLSSKVLHKSSIDLNSFFDILCIDA
jgi:hypothetical protein